MQVKTWRREHTIMGFCTQKACKRCEADIITTKLKCDASSRKIKQYKMVKIWGIFMFNHLTKFIYGN